MTCLVYRHKLDIGPVASELVFEPHREGWACIACSETYGAGVKPLLKFEDLERHMEAHQMGLDYAMVLKRKGVLK